MNEKEKKHFKTKRQDSDYLETKDYSLNNKKMKTLDQVFIKEKSLGAILSKTDEELVVLSKKVKDLEDEVENLYTLVRSIMGGFANR